MGNLQMTERRKVEHRRAKPVYSVDRWANGEVRADGKLAQQIDADGAPARWHIIAVYSGADTVAAAHLVARRFGVYLPTVERSGRRHDGAPYKFRELMFPGYVFVWVWALEKQCRRILSCPGVIGLLPTVANPAVMPDSLIDALQAIEWGEDLAKVASKRRRGYRRGPAVPVHQGKMELTIHTKGAFEGIAGLATDGRISLLHKALSLGQNIPKARVDPGGG